MAQGDFQLFSGLADNLEDPELIAQAQAWADSLRAIFDGAIANEDAGLAQAMADDLADPTLQAQVDALRLKLSELTGLSDMAENSVTPAIDSGTRAMDTFKTQTDTAMTNAETGTQGVGMVVSDVMTSIASGLGLNIGEWDTWQISVIEFINLVAERLIYVQEVLGSMVADATGFNATGGEEGASTGTTTTDKPAASGGERQGTFLTGEEGAELVTTDRRVSVLNNKSTRSIFAWLDAMTHGRLGRPANQVSRTSNLNQTNYISNNAQMFNQQQRDADYLRTGV